MRRSMLLASILLFSWLAQTSYSQQGPKSAGLAPQGHELQSTVVGCLVEENGQLVLSDNSTGNRYLLSGKDAKLNEHTGEMMVVMGEISGSNRPGSMSAGEQMLPTLSVTSFERLSSPCTSITNPQ
jgi:hypothetical protein